MTLGVSQEMQGCPKGCRDDPWGVPGDAEMSQGMQGCPGGCGDVLGDAGMSPGLGDVPGVGGWWGKPGLSRGWKPTSQGLSSPRGGRWGATVGGHSGGSPGLSPAPLCFLGLQVRRPSERMMYTVEGGGQTPGPPPSWVPEGRGESWRWGGRACWSPSPRLRFGQGRRGQHFGEVGVAADPRLCPPSPQNGQRGRMDRGNSLPSMLEQKVSGAGGCGGLGVPRGGSYRLPPPLLADLPLRNADGDEPRPREAAARRGQDQAGGRG